MEESLSWSLGLVFVGGLMSCNVGEIMLWPG